MNPFAIVLLVFMGLAPSFSWLSLYLKKDLHPEPRYLVAQTFILGMISAPFVIFFQVIFPFIFHINSSGPFSDSLSFFLWAAFVEEFFKFAVIWLFIIKNREFDEPIDAMIYMIVAGLGFAAMENILFMFKAFPDGVQSTLSIWALRFVGATFLHALSAAITGYFIAMAWFFHHHAYKLIFLGLALATFFHFIFNLFIIQSSTNKPAILYSFIFLIIFSFLVSVLFRKIWERQIKVAPDS